jgi:hypothetical protein
MKTTLLLLGLASTLLFGCGDSNQGTGLGAPGAANGSNAEGPTSGAADAGLRPPIIDDVYLTTDAPTVSTTDDEAFYVFPVALSFHDHAEMVTAYGIQEPDGSETTMGLPAVDQSELQTNLPLGISIATKSLTGPMVVAFTVFGESGAASLPKSVTITPPSQ